MANVIDLYAGGGGLSLGASRAGFRVSSAVEIDHHAMDTHSKNFPNSIHIEQDIRFLNGDQLLRLSNLRNDQLTGIIGGPPCQGFSTIGRGDVNDERNSLFIKFFSLVEELQPLFFVAENVPGIMNSKYSPIRNQAYSLVRNYSILPPLKIKANQFGAATSRTRYFFIGYRNDSHIRAFNADDIMESKVADSQITTVRQALEGLPDIIYYKPNSKGLQKLSSSYYDSNATHNQSDYFYKRITNMIPDNVGNGAYINMYYQKHLVNGFYPTKHSPEVKRRFKELQYGQTDSISKLRKLNPDSFCPTLRAGTGPEKGSYQAVRPIHYACARVITPREAARLQGFPDWYLLPETIWHGFRQIGNSVSPLVAECILRTIFQRLI